MSDLQPGAKAPHFSAPDQSGEIISLSDFEGKTVVLYFYPKDDTPGCVKEACLFRDNLPNYGKLGTVIVGVSADSIESHIDFAQKFELTFPLLADTDHKIAKAYGVWVEKTYQGVTSMGIERSTFVIAPDGHLQYVLRKVKPDTHPEELLQTLTSFFV